MQSEMSQTPVLSGVATASVGLGFFSMVVFWWYPFSLILSSVGFVLGLICLARKVRSHSGDNIALIGTSLCAIAAGTIITLTQVLHVLTWDR